MRPAASHRRLFQLARDQTSQELKSSGHMVVDRKGLDSEKGRESIGKHILKADGNGAIDMNGQISPVCGRARDLYFR